MSCFIELIATRCLKSLDNEGVGLSPTEWIHLCELVRDGANRRAASQRKERARSRGEAEYHFRGSLPHGMRRLIRECYSENDDKGNAVTRSMTKAECLKDARAQGLRAVFLRDGKREEQ